MSFLFGCSKSQCFYKTGYSGEYWRFCVGPNTLDESIQQCKSLKMNLAKLDDSSVYDLFTVLDKLNKSSNVTSQMVEMTQIFNTTFLGLLNDELNFYEEIRTQFEQITSGLIELQMNAFSQAFPSISNPSDQQHLINFNNSNIQDLINTYNTLSSDINTFQTHAKDLFRSLISNTFNTLNSYKSTVTTSNTYCDPSALGNFLNSGLQNSLYSELNNIIYSSIQNDMISSLRNKAINLGNTMIANTNSRALANTIETALRDKILAYLYSFNTNVTIICDDKNTEQRNHGQSFIDNLAATKNDVTCSKG